MDYQLFAQQLKTKIFSLTKLQKFFLFLILFVILAVTIFFVNPKRKLLEMRNSQRRSDVVNILNAVYKFSQDGGVLPINVTDKPTMICKTGAQSCEGLIDISEVVAKENKTLSEVPVDPKDEDLNSSGYEIWKSASGRINVSAPLAENKAVITLSK